MTRRKELGNEGDDQRKSDDCLICNCSFGCGCRGTQFYATPDARAIVTRRSRLPSCAADARGDCDLFRNRFGWLLFPAAQSLEPGSTDCYDSYRLTGCYPGITAW